MQKLHDVSGKEARRLKIDMRHKLIYLRFPKMFAHICLSTSYCLEQWFPTCLGLRHPAEENYILRHPVANPYNFASRFDDSLQMYF